MSWEDPLQAEILADLSRLVPLHDFVLVKPISDDAVIESQAYGERPVLIHNPRVHMTGDYRWRSDRPRGNRIGKVVAVGRGDKIMVDGIDATACFRAPMHVKEGDTVVFPRVPANEIELNGEPYIFLHEESQVYAIVEEAA